jgi:uncharacterized membrane protein
VSKRRFRVVLSKPVISMGLAIVTVSPLATLALGTAAQVSPCGAASLT